MLHTLLCSLFHSDAYQYSCPAFSSGLIELDIATYVCIGYSVKCIIYFSRICYYCLSISSKADMRYGVSDDLVVNEDRGCFSSQYFKQIISVFIFLRFKLCSLFCISGSSVIQLSIFLCCILQVRSVESSIFFYAY